MGGGLLGGSNDTAKYWDLGDTEKALICTGTVQYCMIMWGTCWVLLGTAGLCKILLGTVSYFWVLAVLGDITR